ncbi:MAG: pyridoxal-phosphate dependent enzyme [Planctomycetes bacterium]|nr:pyridoxal-phosphate dependent enzyme [Planctomycetota bacterium]
MQPEPAATILCKLEFMNPGGSVKDRIGTSMIEAAERSGKHKPGGTIVEGTSGNTGVGLAMVAAVKGYKCIFTMPDKMSQEKVNLLRAFGAEVIVTPTAVEPEDPRSYYSVARRLEREVPLACYPNQYANPLNPEVHYKTTAPELWEQTEGKVDALVLTMGTGGTISGIGRYFKERNPGVRVVGVDPVGSIYTEYFKTRKMPDKAMFKTYKIEGIGEDFMPTTIDFQWIDEVVTVDDGTSFRTARRMCREEGIFAGGSSGTCMAAALQVASCLGKGKTVVALLPDSGSRYLSTFYNDEWMRRNQFHERRVQMTARDLLGRKAKKARLLSVRSTDRILVAIGQLKARDISQVPVIDEGQLVGSLREETLLDNLINNPRIGDLIVAEAMGSPPPVVQEDASADEILRILREGNPSVLVRRSDGSLDVLTKFDLLQGIPSLDGGA